MKLAIITTDLDALTRYLCDTPADAHKPLLVLLGRRGHKSEVALRMAITAVTDTCTTDD